MNPMPRFAPSLLKSLTLAAVLAAPMGWIAPAMAQPAAAVAPTQAEKDLKSAVENYWHYAKVGRYDLATAEGQKVVASAETPLKVLETFEVVSAEHQDAQRLDQLLLHWQSVPQMKEINDQVIKLISEGHIARRSDPKFIQDHISRLTTNSRAYGLAVTRLRESGELAVPFLVEVLRDPAKKTIQPTIRQALRDMGRMALNPLVAATEMKDWETLSVIVGVLGDMGYDAAAPYVARVYESPDAPGSVKASAAEALAKLGAVRAQGAGGAADMFFLLGEKFYDGASAITADNRFPNANVWYWEQTLARKEVPHPIYNDIMAMRASEYTLKLGGPRSDDALALWLAANYKREADLPEGATDATRAEGNPNGHYWGVQTGSKYLNMALARALEDRNAAVAFRAIRSLQEIVGQSNLFIDNSSRPLIAAMQYPDRRVRFEAAFALAEALPQTKFEGQQRVVPLLAEAISQTGQTSVLVVMPTTDAANKMVEDLRTAGGFAAAGSGNYEGAISAAATLASVDVILVSEDIGEGNVATLFNLASSTPRLAGAARLVMTRTNASRYEPMKVGDQLLNTTTATDAAGLKPAIEAARGRTGSLPLDPDTATEYATRAGELMIKVGISRGQVYDLLPAKPTLLAALTDTRPEIVKLAGEVVGLLNDKDAQAGLLNIALEEKTANDVKISLYKSLAVSAKFWGNKLDASQIESLEKVVAEFTDLEVRSAAAEARGALNLPADQAKGLIVNQSKV